MSNADQAWLDQLADKGAQLHEVRRDLLRQQPGATQRWFQGPDGCDLFLWYREPGPLQQIQLTLLGRVIEWSDADGVRTGRLLSFDPLRPTRDMSRLVFDRAPEPETIRLARAFLVRAGVDDVTLALVRVRLGLK